MYKLWLGMSTAWHNNNGKIWVFVEEEYQVETQMDTEQLLSLKLTHLVGGQEVVITMVYANTDRTTRVALWNDLFHISCTIDSPWLVGGDFNVIVDEIEKYGGLEVPFVEVEDFNQCINLCQLMDLGFKGSMYTWWNGRSDEHCIFKRLDRCLANQKLQDLYPNIEVEHLIKQGSDHSPMLLTYKVDSRVIKKSFRFLNFWIKHPTFKDVVKDNWTGYHGYDPFFIFHSKLKKLSKVLSKWSRDAFGDIFRQIDTLEEKNSFGNRNLGCNGSRMEIETLNFFMPMYKFTAEPEATDFELLEHIPKLISREQNRVIHEFPEEEEIKEVVFGLNANSAGGPDGYTGKFFQAAWDIIAKDIVNMVHSFFCGHELPRYITCTNLVLLPKRKEVITCSDLRLISLSNFISKVFSRIIHKRLVKLLPQLISPQQTGFVKGRSIVENILLVQEIVHEIRIRGKPANTVIKLDMAKAYDRVSWLFLTKVLRKMGFGEMLINMVYRIISNNWYSILINGQAQGFFKSSRGVKQGDPLSPTLFIITSECMTRALNHLHYKEGYVGYGMPKWSPYINHLAYADDTIIFTSAQPQTLKLVMETLAKYEKVSGQKINKEKSVVYLHQSVSQTVANSVVEETNIPRKDFPFTYLGVPIYYERRRIAHFKEITNKIQNRLSLWTGKLLSMGGRTTLINHVLQSMPVHLLSACDPPSGVLAQIQRLFAKNFWSNSVGNSSKHWTSWTTLCHPKEEGGMGFRCLQDMSKALFAKLWWNFRTKQSLWRTYMSNKYLKKHNAILAQWKGGTYVWEKMLQCRDVIDHEIWWQLKQGNCQFWLDNWTGIGALYQMVPPNFQCDYTVVQVKEVQEDGRWKEGQIRELLPVEMANHIIQKVKPPTGGDTLDRLYWKLDSKGIFSVSSAFQVMRQRKETSKIYEYMWVKGLPIKISFFTWRLWQRKLPLDDTLKKWGFQFASKCRCCLVPQEETIAHVFLNSNVAQITWKYFCGPVGISILGMQLTQVITTWWELAENQHTKMIYQIIPVVIVWELWKRRNTIQHGGKVSVNKLKYKIMHTVILFMKTRRSNFKYAPYSWQELLKSLQSYSPKVKIYQVCWRPPDSGWIKCNTDGASRGNPGRSSWGFCLRNTSGDLVFAQSHEMRYGNYTNTQAEAEAIMQALKYTKRMNIQQMIVETDSMIMKNVMERKWQVPWQIINVMEEIWRIMGERTVVVNHIFREGNKLADFLTNLALDRGDYTANSFQEMDTWGSKLINSDKSNIPYLRVRNCRR
ncbi:uncharacterized protein LOC132611743 [Lycium barbarum]|uniref:uncharacterized protein LOC132611743 n=1 Tax=Lycium barbarum TaxID=112863 RepID=UPI00293E8F21|nr:uncharacterized protein LOC132611743 [Lycium barbarum]